MRKIIIWIALSLGSYLAYLKGTIDIKIFFLTTIYVGIALLTDYFLEGYN